MERILWLNANKNAAKTSGVPNESDAYTRDAYTNIYFKLSINFRLVCL